MSADQLQLEIDKIGRECLCLQSRMTTRAITRRYNAVLDPIGLEVTEFSLLPRRFMRSTCPLRNSPMPWLSRGLPLYETSSTWPSAA